MRPRTLLSDMRKDFPASIVVLLVALPLCLGIAVGSNAPPMSGIIAGVVGGIVIGLLSGSPLSVSGPAAGLTAIVVSALEVLPFDQFLMSVVLAGVLQIALGYARAGIMGDYVPNAVIKGMLAAIGIILILKQLPHLVGHDADYEGDETFLQPDQHNTFSELMHSIPDITPLAAVIGICCLVLLVIFEQGRIKQLAVLKIVPAPLIAVVLGVLLDLGLNGEVWHLRADQRVDIPFASENGGPLGLLSHPDLTALLNTKVWTTAVILALVASLETLLSIEAVDKLDPLKRITPTDRELKAQGVGNMVSGLLGGLPVTSVIVRSSANVNAGARSKASTILHGAMLLGCVLLIPQVMNLVPKAALAAILIITGYKLARIGLFRDQYRRGWDQFIPFVITIGAILLLDLLRGVMLGVLVGLFFVVRSNFRSAIIHVQQHDVHLLRLRKEVSFLNKPLIKRTLDGLPAGHTIIIDVARADMIDRDVVDVIADFCAHAHLSGNKVIIEHTSGRKAHRLFDEFAEMPGVTMKAKEDYRIPTF